MRRTAAHFSSAVLVGLLAIGCGSAAPAAQDPYDLLASSTKATWDPIQANLGIVVKDGSTTVTVDPSAIAVVIDSAGGRGGVHVSLPAASLGMDPAALATLGVTGSSIDFDMVYDGDALYGRSPLLAQMLTFVLRPTGDLPSGDLMGWLRLGTNEEFVALGGLIAGTDAFPSFAPPPSTNASAPPMKQSLDDLGLSLTLGDTGQRSGAEARQVKVAIDPDKLLASPAFRSVTGAQLSQMRTVLQQATMSGELWIATASSRVVEIDLHVASKADPTQAGDVTLAFRDPDGSVPLTAPPAHVDVKMDALFRSLMQMIGKGIPTA